MDLTPAYQRLRNTARENYYGDPHGWAMGWLYSVADTLYHRKADIPYQWGFAHGMGCDGTNDGNEWESEMIAWSDVDSYELRNFGHTLNRYIDWVKLAGRDY